MDFPDHEQSQPSEASKANIPANNPFQVERVMTEYAILETELVKHRGEGRIEIEEFLEKKAEQTHNEIVRKLRINDEKITSYHQVLY